MKGNNQYPATISFRPANPELNQRIERLAKLERRPVSQLVRIMVEDAVAERERQLGLSPLSDEENAADSPA
ncbi:MAG: hypothetical protein RQ899_13105 [Pseudomonadales bacterium]|nr:hypothetical protein [Pseudomonadales bacterium]